MIYVETNYPDIFGAFGCEIFFASERDLGDDVLLLWRTPPTLVIGRFQNALAEIDAEYAREHGVTVARRLSGGGTMYMDRGGWEFSVITRRGGSGEIDFARFVDPMVDALRSLGVDAERSGRNDITVGGKKVSGNSQFHVGPVTVHHGTLLYDTDLDALARATRPKAYKIESKGIPSVRERVVNIRDTLPEARRGMTSEQFRDVLVGFLADATYRMTPEEEARTAAIGDERFRDEKILYAATPTFAMEKTVHTPGGSFGIGLRVKQGRIEDAGVTGDFFADADAADELAGALKGKEFTPQAVREAVRPFEGRFFRAGTEDLVRGIFE